MRGSEDSGEEGAKLKKLFPDMLFTIGDNDTMLLLRVVIVRKLK